MLPEIVTTLPEPMALVELTARLSLASILGASVGFNADRNRRPAGMRLYATVSLLGALMALVTISSAPEQATLALTGALLSCSFVVGLICLGLILQQTPYSRSTPGLTAAASLALATVIGLAAGGGLWKLALMADVIALAWLKGGRFLSDRTRPQENPR